MRTAQTLVTLIVALMFERSNHQHQIQMQFGSLSSGTDSPLHTERSRIQRPLQQQQLQQNTANQGRPNVILSTQRRVTQMTNIGSVLESTVLRDGKFGHANITSSISGARSLQRDGAHGVRDRAPHKAPSNVALPPTVKSRVEPERTSPSASSQRLTKFLVRVPNPLFTPPPNVSTVRTSGQLSRGTQPRRLMRPPQNVARRPTATQIHISTTPVRSAQPGHPESKPPLPTSSLVQRGTNPQSLGEAANRFPSSTPSQAFPASAAPFGQIQVSQSLSSNAQIRIPAAMTPSVPGQDAQNRAKQQNAGHFPSLVSLPSATNADFATASLVQTSAASQPQFRGQQKPSPPSMPIRSRIATISQQPLPARIPPVTTTIVPSPPQQFQMQQTLPQQKSQVSGILTASPAQQSKTAPTSFTVRQPSVIMPMTLQHQQPIGFRPGQEQPLIQRFQTATQFTSPRPQILRNEELVQNQLQITRNSVKGEQELGPIPPAPQSGRQPLTGDGAPGFLPPSDFVVNKLNGAEDFMAIAESMQLKRRFKGQRRRRRQAEFRAWQKQISDLRS
uniref:Uncharacterized protein n=1 Tax=Parascaris univalens TaxID=6257 RepID=A0A915BPV1_PARUN